MNRQEFEQSVEAVYYRASAVELARLRRLLNGTLPPSEVIEAFSRTQRDDGGWAPFWAPDYSGIDATCYQLAQAFQLGLDPKTPFVTDAIRFLATRQAADGSWEEDSEQADNAPPWAMPGDLAARLYLTSNAGYWLAQSGLAPTGSRNAAEYLSAVQGAEGEMPSFLQTCWLAAGLWHQLGYTTQATRVLAHLDAQLDKLPAGDLAWLLITLLQVGISRDASVVVHGMGRLESLRSVDGIWHADEGMGNEVQVTIDSLYALKLGGV